MLSKSNFLDEERQKAKGHSKFFVLSNFELHYLIRKAK